MKNKSLPIIYRPPATTTPEEKIKENLFAALQEGAEEMNSDKDLMRIIFYIGRIPFKTRPLAFGVVVCDPSELTSGNPQKKTNRRRK